MTNETTGTLKIFFYVANPNRPDMPSDTRVRFSRRTLYTGYALTQDEAAIVARDFRQMNHMTEREVTALWQADPVELR
jgi:hypothetical protein